MRNNDPKVTEPVTTEPGEPGTTDDAAFDRLTADAERTEFADDFGVTVEDDPNESVALNDSGTPVPRRTTYPDTIEPEENNR